jgi:hypothetical protein
MLKGICLPSRTSDLKIEITFLYILHAFTRLLPIKIKLTHRVLIAGLRAGQSSSGDDCSKFCRLSIMITTSVTLLSPSLFQSQSRLSSSRIPSQAQAQKPVPVRSARPSAQSHRQTARRSHPGRRRFVAPALPFRSASSTSGSLLWCPTRADGPVAFTISLLSSLGGDMAVLALPPKDCVACWRRHSPDN